MKHITQEELDQVIADHKLWLANPTTGKRANLSCVNLAGTNLYRADLLYADLRSADLSAANLSHANLSGADLSDANLRRADLLGANLYGANLTGANLTDTSLAFTDLSYANLMNTNLVGTYLLQSYLQGTKLPHPVYQFFVGKDYAVATPDGLRIGCEVHPWETWLNAKRCKEIALKAGYSKAELKQHVKAIRLFHKLVQETPS